MGEVSLTTPKVIYYVQFTGRVTVVYIHELLINGDDNNNNPNNNNPNNSVPGTGVPESSRPLSSVRASL